MAFKFAIDDEGNVGSSPITSRPAVYRILTRA